MVLVSTISLNKTISECIIKRHIQPSLYLRLLIWDFHTRDYTEMDGEPSVFLWVNPWNRGSSERATALPLPFNKSFTQYKIIASLKIPLTFTRIFLLKYLKRKKLTFSDGFWPFPKIVVKNPPLSFFLPWSRTHFKEMLPCTTNFHDWLSKLARFCYI